MRRDGCRRDGATLVARILSYALGAGLGHLTRQAALAAEATARGHSVQLLCSGALARLVAARLTRPGLSVEHPDPSLSKDDVRRWVLAKVSSAQAELLVVDTFPRGLLGELTTVLPRLRAPAVLVHRALKRAYAQRVEVLQALEYYRQVLVPGEPAAFEAHRPCVRTEPWLSAPARQWLPREKARAAFGVADERPLVVVVGTGNEREVAEMVFAARSLRRRLAACAHVREVVPEQAWCFPLLPYLPGVDVLVGAGGYNTVHEARATGTPLLALSRERLYDVQADRLTPEERLSSLAELPVRIEPILRTRMRRPQEAAGGVQQAMDTLAPLLSQ